MQQVQERTLCRFLWNKVSSTGQANRASGRAGQTQVEHKSSTSQAQVEHRSSTGQAQVKHSLLTSWPKKSNTPGVEAAEPAAGEPAPFPGPFPWFFGNLFQAQNSAAP